MDRFLSWFGLARRRDVVRLEETQDKLKKAAEDLRAERNRAQHFLELERRARVIDTGRQSRVVGRLLDEVAEMRAS